MSSNQSINKTPNSRFLLFSHRCTQTLDFSAYLSPNQDEPGLTRLTWNTDRAFLNKKRKNKKSTFSANAFDSTKPRILISFNTLTHPSPIFIILQNVVRFTSNEWYYNIKQQVIKKKQSWVLAQFCKSKRYQIQKKRIHETTKISISPPHFFLWSPSKPIKATK